MKPRIKGKVNHKNYSLEHFLYLKSKKESGTTSPSERWYTKKIDDQALRLYYEINDLRKMLRYSIIDLLFLAKELQCTIGKFTLEHFFNEKYGPAFPPTKATRESLLRILNRLKSEYKAKNGKKYSFK